MCDYRQLTLSEFNELPPPLLRRDNQLAAADHISSFCNTGVKCVIVDKESSRPVRVIECGDDDHDNDDIRFIPTKYNLAIQTGVESGCVAINVGKIRGSFVPNLDKGDYGVNHTSLGVLLTTTRRVISPSGSTYSIILGIHRDEWPDGLNSSTLVQPTLDGRGAINLIADGGYQLIEPSVDPITDKRYLFYTPYRHIDVAGSGFKKQLQDNHQLFSLGIMTLTRSQLSELIRGFNKNWTNGSVFARKNHAVSSPVKDEAIGGLDAWF